MEDRIFISSPCYDLIDLRAEVENDLLSLGLVPILSDSSISEFSIHTDQNSIETCLINLKSCDAVIIILSQRYGPSLKTAGFEDISATHLEYKTAIKNNIPVYFYVRDRLEADHYVYSKSGDPKLLKWVIPKDIKIFSFLDEHKKLENDTKNNWYWTFRDSIELKTRIRKDLKKQSGAAIVKRLLQSGTSPLLTLEVRTTSIGSDSLRIELIIRNVGNSVAIEPYLLYFNVPYNEYIEYNSEAITAKHTGNRKLNTILASGFHPVALIIPKSENVQQSISVEIIYTTIQGYNISDASELTIDFDNSGHNIIKTFTVYKHKEYVHSEGIKTISRLN